MRGLTLTSVLTLMLTLATPAIAQLPPVRQLGPMVTSSEALMSVPSVRGLSDGRVLVSDMTRRRLVLLDTALAHPEVVLTPSGAVATTYPARGGTLFALPGDTTLVLDAAGASFMVIDRAGKVVKVESVPRVTDVFYMSNAAYGQPGIDSLGRLIYRIQAFASGYNQRTNQMVYPDSSPILSVNFDTRKVDTLGYMKTALPAQSINTTDADGTRRFITMSKPFELMDDWAMLPSGHVAIIRWRDYHVDWIEPGSKKVVSSPKTDWNWVRLTDDEKARFIDSLKARNLKADSMTNRINGGMMMGPGFSFVWETMTVAPSEVPDYPPPFVPRATRVDAEGRIWVLERAKLALPTTGLIYDVIDRSGQIVDRVQAPPNAAVIGFGAGGAVYLSVAPSNAVLANNVPPVPPPPGPTPPPSPTKLAKAILPKKP